MKKQVFYGILFAGIIALVFSLNTFRAEATQPAPYKVICHHNPSQDVTLSFQNEQSYNGHLGTPHSDTVYDTDGACVEPTEGPTPTNVPECEYECEPTPTEEATPSATPTFSPPPCNECGSDGLSDHRSDGRSSGGQVLGESIAPCTNETCGWK